MIVYDYGNYKSVDHGDDGFIEHKKLLPINQREKGDNVMTRHELMKHLQGSITHPSFTRSYDKCGNFISETIHNV